MATVPFTRRPEFQGKLEVRIHPYTANSEYFRRGEFQESDMFRYGTTRFRTDEVWFSAPELVFDGTVSLEGSSNHSDWQVGILQALSRATWAGCYSGGAEIHYRANTEFGLLTDIRRDESIFMSEPGSFRASPSNPQQFIGKPYVPGRDAPSIALLREFSGDLSSPKQEPLQRLTATRGEICLSTFLVAANQQERVIITLGRCDWTVNFNGGFDFDRYDWTPEQRDIVTVQFPEEGGVYDDLSNSTRLPFSISLDSANAAKEIQVEGRWVKLNRCVPGSNEGYVPSGRRWC